VSAEYGCMGHQLAMFHSSSRDHAIVHSSALSLLAPKGQQHCHERHKRYGPTSHASSPPVCTCLVVSGFAKDVLLLLFEGSDRCVCSLNPNHVTFLLFRRVSAPYLVPLHGRVNKKPVILSDFHLTMNMGISSRCLTGVTVLPKRISLIPRCPCPPRTRTSTFFSWTIRVSSFTTSP